jgi:outer membrane protein OmpA-like peptidoglycan-associated protein
MKLQNVKLVDHSITLMNYLFKIRYSIYLILSFVNSNSFLTAQIRSFQVSKVTFTSSVGDDFSPVYYKNGLVYCSNSISSATMSIKSENENLFNILFVEQKDSVSWKSPVLFSEELTTILNEGPATFSPDGNTIYYARNNTIEGKLKDINKPLNRLGIYKAELIDGVWKNISPFPYNNPDYSLGTPALSTDGNRLYFASDMPGGFGGIDIYYCDLKDGQWAKPVNIGPEINTEADEAYPFADATGRVFFSSNGHNSIGGKDIFYTLIKNKKWITPIHLDADINSPDDDFGLITDANFEHGYFSSNRKRNTDIYSFVADIPQFGICSEQADSEQCFRFFDERFTDTLHLNHEWDFGNGVKKKGISIEQCFSKPGKYLAVLSIVHHFVDSTYYIRDEYPFEIQSVSSPYILSEDATVVNRQENFNALVTNTTEIKYYWNFGSGFSDQKSLANNTFNVPGDYTISLGIQQNKNAQGIKVKSCISKTIKVFDDYQQLAVYLKKRNNEKPSNTEAKLNLTSTGFSIQNYYVGKFDGPRGAAMSSALDSMANYGLNFDENSNPLSGSLSILDYYIDILNNDPGIKLDIAIHQKTKGSAKSDKEQTDWVAEKLKNYLIQRVINNTRVTCTGYGDTRTITDKGRSNGQSGEKRIEFILIRDSDK